MKKGFTLVELLAVIAILAILVIIALPNVMGMFNTAKENSFNTEVKEVFKTAQQTWINDTMFESGEKEYSRCKSGCKNSLDLSGRSELEYYIKINQSGDVVEYYATDGTFQYTYAGSGLKIENIKNVQKTASLASDKKVSITKDGVINKPVAELEFCAYVGMHDCGWYDYKNEMTKQYFNYASGMSIKDYMNSTYNTSNVFSDAVFTDAEREEYEFLPDTYLNCVKSIITKYEGTNHGPEYYHEIGECGQKYGTFDEAGYGWGIYQTETEAIKDSSTGCYDLRTAVKCMK